MTGKFGSLLLASQLAVGAMIGSAAAAPAQPLSEDAAFSLTAARSPAGTILLTWTMPPGYYLYRDRMSARVGDREVALLLKGAGETKADPTFGQTEIFRNRLSAELVLPDGASAASGVAGPIQVTYQGCQEGGICYLPRTRQEAGGTRWW